MENLYDPGDEPALKSDGWEPNPEWLAQLRETQPEATETEAWLLERLIGSLGMVRRLMTHGSYMVDGRDGFEVMDEFLLKRYGWKLRWRDPNPKRRSAHKAG